MTTAFAVIKAETDTWDEPLDEIYDIPRIVSALAMAGFPIRKEEA